MSEPTSSSKAYPMPESDASNPSLSMPVGPASEPSAISPVSSSRPRKSPKPKGLNLATLVSRYGTSEKCRELRCRLRWNNGQQCPRCNDAAVELETDTQLFYCKRCDYQFTVTAGTIFNDSHLPLEKWFMATLLLCEAKKGISAHQIHRTLGISYKTAWYLCHRIRAAMKEAAKGKLTGTVEMDETYIGGRAIGKGHAAKNDNKEIVIGIRQRNGDLRLFHANDVKAGTLAQYIRENVKADVDVIITDDFASYPNAAKIAGIPHKSINHSGHVYVMGEVHTNTVESAFSLLKRGIVGTWHRISAKHLPAYLTEMEFRFNRRKNPNLFLDTLRHMVTADPLTFQTLTA